MCADVVNLCQGNPCDDVSCASGLVCNPQGGDCVACLEDANCGESEICLNSECVQVSGQDREISPPQDEVPPPCANNSTCTDDEECSNTPLGNACLLSCSETELCPQGFNCCVQSWTSGFCLPEDSWSQNFCE